VTALEVEEREISSSPPEDGRPDLARRALMEAIGAFAIVVAGCGAVVADATRGGALGAVGISLVFGLIVMVMIYAGGHLSGAHYNPGVTVAFTLARHFPPREAVTYVAAQLVGAIAGAFLLLAAWPDAPADLGATVPSVGVGAALLYEVVLTAFLMFVITAVATDRRRGGDRDRRHGRAGRAVRRPGHRRVDEPGPQPRACARGRAVDRLLDLHRRAACRRRDRRLRLRAGARRPLTLTARARV
jgi:hypothetical protein